MNRYLMAIAAAALAGTAGFTSSPAGARTATAVTGSGGTSGEAQELPGAAAALLPRWPVTKYAGEMFSVSAVSSSDAWAVGTSGGPQSRVLHWNGSSWAPLATPHPGAIAALYSVSALSPVDSWAVGQYSSGASQKDLVLRWNGTRWTQAAVPSPGKAPVLDALTGVSALAPSDAWAVGSFGTLFTGKSATLILHWDGTRWTRITSPSPSALADLTAVSALSPRDAWAVGEYFPKFLDKTLVLHWNGTRWSRVPSPSPSGQANLQAVSALSPTNVWAVGQLISANGALKTLVLHWNGSSWRQAASPSPGGSATPSFSNLSGVSALSPADAWAVGSYGHFTAQAAAGKPLMLHWNGTTWKQVASPFLGTDSVLNGVAALSSSHAWAVGGSLPRFSTGTTLVLRWNGKNWMRS
jgi:hypothetical protein